MTDSAVTQRAGFSGSAKLVAWALRAAELRELRGAAGALAETAPRPDRKAAPDRDAHV